MKKLLKMEVGNLKFIKKKKMQKKIKLMKNKFIKCKYLKDIFVFIYLNECNLLYY